MVSRGRNANVSKPKLCGACSAARRRESKARWAEVNKDRVAETRRTYKSVNRERIREAARVPGVVGRILSCQRCAATFERVGARGPDALWCPKCRMIRNAEICTALRERHPEAFRDHVKVHAAIRRAAVRISTELVIRAEVYARDEWTCRLCGLSVQADLKWPDPGSPSLDHIVPLSRGGGHTYANVQLAHLRCNLVKGNRTVVA